ncbi:hypothetical protein FQA47_013151 [Oryzias melastigma]|uniref:Uncharacterized protein n=1 Tax=Oryzias melastigma TaxID=30732 RepID=A0A834BUC0_ORYME|nr:hypothetical protein FQA47_013151 [Oryzias melastigma]
MLRSFLTCRRKRERPPSVICSSRQQGIAVNQRKGKSRDQSQRGFQEVSVLQSVGEGQQEEEEEEEVGGAAQFGRNLAGAETASAVSKFCFHVRLDAGQFGVEPTAEDEKTRFLPSGFPFSGRQTLAAEPDLVFIVSGVRLWWWYGPPLDDQRRFGKIRFV